MRRFASGTSIDFQMLRRHIFYHDPDDIWPIGKTGFLGKNLLYSNKPVKEASKCQTNETDFHKDEFGLKQKILLFVKKSVGRDRNPRGKRNFYKKF
jgi:hypothetical protein